MARTVVLGAAAGAALVGTLAYPLGLHFRLFELFNFFRPEIFLAALGSLALSLLLGDPNHRRLMTLLVLTNLFLLAFPVFEFRAHHTAAACRPEPPARGNSIRILTFNVFEGNRDVAAFESFLARQNPDVFVLQELKRRWRWALMAQGPNWPFQYSLGLDLGTRGLAIFSRWPLTLRSSVMEDLENEKDRVLAISADVETEAGPLRIYALHSPTPRSESLWAARASLFDLLGRELEAPEATSPRIVVGDWNMSRWSPFYLRFMETAGLREASSEFLPSNTRIFLRNIFGELVGSAVDHLALSPEIGVECYRMGPQLGSDHLPLVVDLRLPGR